jgi:hypothetical protein
MYINFHSCSSLTLDDEKRATGQLVTGFVRKIDYGRDFEQQLNFFVEARASFCNLDPVLVCLVQVSCRLTRLGCWFPSTLVNFDRFGIFHYLFIVFFPLSVLHAIQSRSSYRNVPLF